MLISGGITVIALAVGVLQLSCQRPSREPQPVGKILLVGIDGADWQYIHPLIERGELPTFSRLCREGATGTLRSLRGTIMSPVVWATISTGRGPLEHGIQSFTVADPATGEETQVTSALRREKAFWNIFSEQGRRVALVGWSITWPAEPVMGEVISSFLPFTSPDSTRAFTRVTYPDSLAAEMLALRVGPSDIGPEDLVPFVGDLDLDILDAPEREALGVLRWAIACDETFRAVVRRVIPEKADLTAVFIGGVDKSGHRFMQYRDPEGCAFRPRPQVAAAFGGVIDAYYRYADTLLGEFIAEAGLGTTVFVISDHGFRSIPVEEAVLGWEWHRQEGIFILWGAGVKKGVRLPEANVFDVTPTLLYIAGLPLSEDMRGKPIAGAFEDWVAKRKLPSPVETYRTPGWKPEAGDFVSTPQGKGELELLRSLGYIR